MTAHIDVIKDFVNYGNDIKNGSRVFFVDDVIFSYGFHFPMAIRMKDGFVLNKDGYSQSTSRHKNMLRRLLEPSEIKKEVTTEEIQSIIGEFSHKLRFISSDDLEKMRMLKELEK